MPERNDLPLVSIIVPCYRQAHYLPVAIDSALAQTYPNVETLVVNDGSPDDTEAVARSYGDRIRYVWRPNGGLSAARNTGIAQARGTYLKFLDSDDHLHPDVLARQVEALGGRTDCVSHTTVRLYRDGHPEQYEDHVPTATALLPDLFRDIPWGGIHGFLFPADLTRQVGGFDESLRCVEDWDLLCRLGLAGAGFVADKRVGAYYRLRVQSMSTNRKGMGEAQAQIIIRLHDVLRQRGRPDWFGPDLLRYEQDTYQGLTANNGGDALLRGELLRRIQELQRHLGIFGHYGWRFRLLVRLLGYARAEQLRGFIVRRRRKQAAVSLDMGDWRATQ